MTARWSKDSACQIIFPSNIKDKYAELSLQCTPK